MNGCVLLRCTRGAYVDPQSPSEVLCSIHHAMFHNSPEGTRYGRIAAAHTIKVQAMSLTERFTKRLEIQQAFDNSHTAMRVEVLAWINRIEAQLTDVRGCTNER